MRRTLLVCSVLLSLNASCGGKKATVAPAEKPGTTAEAAKPPPPAVAPPPVDSAKVFFFGHSLVDQDMPMMIGSFAKARGKSWEAHGQLGWGTPLSAHYNWDGKKGKSAPLGFNDENRPPFFVGEGKAQLETGQYDVLVITESNGHTRTDGDETVDYATRLVKLARKARPDIRVFLYANWLDRKEFPDEKAWRLNAITGLKWWESVADRVNAAIDGPDIYVLPVGLMLGRVTLDVFQGKLPGLKVDDLFREKDGVHVNDRGFYFVALIHYAAIFRDSPIGLPVETETEDGPAETLSPDVAKRLQEITWNMLTRYPRTGLPQTSGPAN
jgi:hypothetical protein